MESLIKPNSDFKNMKDSSAYVQVIGEESPKGTTTLSDGVNKIKSSKRFETIIENPKDIKFDTTIYLVAHGDDPTVCSSVGFGSKSPERVIEIFDDIFKKTSLDKSEFKGKIILEGCHSAEPILDKDSREKLKEVLSLKESGKHSFNALRDKCTIEKNSFLADFLHLFKEKYKSQVAPEVVVGGYLGAAFEGDYHKTGYGKAYSENPLTIKYQESQKISGDKKATGVMYDEEHSFLECRINQTLDFGIAGKAGKSR